MGAETAEAAEVGLGAGASAALAKPASDEAAAIATRATARVFEPKAAIDSLIFFSVSPLRIFRFSRLLLFGLSAALLAASVFSLNADPHAERSAFVSGKSKCLDCADKNIKTELAYQGLQVAIKCKNAEGGYEVKGAGDVNKNGDYKVRLPADLVGEDGVLKSECFAKLHSASNTPCPDKNGLNPSKIALKSKEDGVRTFSTAAELPFSSATCASAYFCKWPHYKKYPPIYKKPYYKPIYKKYPPIYKKPYYKPIYKKPWPPIYKKPYHDLPKYPPTYTMPAHP